VHLSWASTIPRSSSGDWLTVMRPSAQSAAQAAVCGLIAPATSFGGSSGSDHSRARSTTTSPRWLTSSPRHSARITSTHSRSRAIRTSLGGQGSPVTCSLSASPLPTATHGKRPGNIAPRVAMAWAEMTGW
jgi:hypothetical protein